MSDSWIRSENWIPALEWLLANVDFECPEEREEVEFCLRSYRRHTPPEDSAWGGFLRIRGITPDQILLFKLTWCGQ